MILVDSDVLIEHLRGNGAARDWLVRARHSSGPLAISVVTLTEIAGGMRSPERREVVRLLGSMLRFEVTERVAWQAAALMREYRRSHSGIGLGDYLIAATALTEGTELATMNVHHYPMFPELARPFLPETDLSEHSPTQPSAIMTPACVPNGPSAPTRSRTASGLSPGRASPARPAPAARAVACGDTRSGQLPGIVLVARFPRWVSSAVGPLPHGCRHR